MVCSSNGLINSSQAGLMSSLHGVNQPKRQGGMSKTQP